MKQVYLKPRGGFRAPLRSDTLFGLITWGVRQVYGRASVERFLEPLSQEPAQAPLVVTSAFPYREGPRGRVHYFPRPLPSYSGNGSAGAWIEERELLAYVTGHSGPASGTEPSLPAPRIDQEWRAGGPVHRIDDGGLFFFAEGSKVHYLEAALGFLERFGFGGQGSTGRGAFQVELHDTEFLRLAQPGELALLLSLYHPTSDERQAIATAAGATDGSSARRVHYRIERRRGVAGGRLAPVEKRYKPAVAMLTEGSVLPYAGGASAGRSPTVGTMLDGGQEFNVVQHGFGFFVPIAGGAS